MKSEVGGRYSRLVILARPKYN